MKKLLLEEHISAFVMGAMVLLAFINIISRIFSGFSGRTHCIYVCRHHNVQRRLLRLPQGAHESYSYIGHVQGLGSAFLHDNELISKLFPVRASGLAVHKAGAARDHV